jgi:hypothetical protein
MTRLFAIAHLALSGCLHAQSEINDCLPAAIAAKEIMEKQGVAAKVLVVRWQEEKRERGHAYTIFRYGKKWSYDKDFGSIVLNAEIAPHLDAAYWEAWESNYKRGHTGTINTAYYLEP